MSSYGSILAKIDSRGERVPRVRLRELPEDASAPSQASARGQTGRYEVVGEIGRGAVGEVFKGRDVDLGRDVAMKILRQDHREDADLVRRFVEEAQVGGQLQHPGIVPVYELGLQADQRPYFAMKLVKGRTLAALLDEREGPAAQRRHFLSIFAQVCQTIAYAHSRGVVHRDLKPGNVMVGAFGEVQVVDWGFAKVLPHDDERVEEAAGPMSTVRTTGDASASIAGAVMGTPGYMPPEQALGRVDEIDERSDVFALGAILTEILTGSPAFVGTPAQMLVLAARCRTEDAFARLGECGADPKLVELARACLSLQRSERPGAAALAAAVTHHLAAVEERVQQSRLAAIEARRKAAEAQARRAEAQAKSEAARAAAEKEKAKAERARRQAEQAAVEADRARKTRKQVVLLAAAAVAVVLAGGGAFWFVAKGRSERARETAAQVDRALQSARLSKGLKHWEEALHAARQAVELGGGSEAQAALAEIVKAKSAADAATQRRNLELQFLERLATIRLQREDRTDDARTDAAYARAFREFGIDVRSLDPQAAKSKIRAVPEWPEIVGALDEWAWQGAEAPPQLNAILAAADPDPVRNELRAERDPHELKALVEQVDAKHPPLRTISLMGLALGAAGDEAGATRLLRGAWERHSGDLWLNVRLAGLLARAGRHQEAARFQVAALALRPRSVKIRAWLAESLCASGEPSAAVAVGRDAAALAPEDPLARAALAAALVCNGEREEGMRVYEQALALTEDASSVHLAFGRALSGPATHDLRIPALDKAVNTSARPSYFAYVALGTALADAGRQERAVEALREAVALAPRAPEGRRRLGNALHAAGRHADAVRALRALIELTPYDWRAYDAVAGPLNALGDHGAALREAGRALELAPSRAEPHLSLGRSRLGRGELREAWKAFYKARGLGSPAYQGIGYTLAAMGELEQAEIATREALRLDPRNAAAQRDLGHVLYRRGEFERAARWLRAAHEAGDGAASLEWARLLALHDVAGARAALDAARKRDAGLAPAASRAEGVVHLQSDDVDAALESLRAALEGDVAARAAFSFDLANHRALTWLHLGHAHLRQGELDAARTAFNKSHDLGTDAAHWTRPSYLWVGECEELLAGEDTVALAKRRYYERKWDESAELFDKAIAQGLEGERFMAARAAARAGKRTQALAWLREGLQRNEPRLGYKTADERREARDLLLELFELPDFRPYRVEDRLQRIPQPERGEWRAFWVEVRLALAKRRPQG